MEKTGSIRFLTLFFVFFIGAGTILLVTNSCDLGSTTDDDEIDDGGGAGADFDASLYYTKTQTDSMIATVNGKIPQILMPGTEFSDAERSLTTDGYSNAVNWTKPNMHGVLLLITITSAGGDDPVSIAVGLSEANYFEYTQRTTGNGAQQYLAFFPLGGGTDPIKAWLTQTYAGVTVKLQPTVWFPAQ